MLTSILFFVSVFSFTLLPFALGAISLTDNKGSGRKGKIESFVKAVKAQGELRIIEAFELSSDKERKADISKVKGVNLYTITIGDTSYTTGANVIAKLALRAELKEICIGRKDTKKMTLHDDEGKREVTEDYFNSHKLSGVLEAAIANQKDKLVKKAK